MARNRTEMAEHGPVFCEMYLPPAIRKLLDVALPAGPLRIGRHFEAFLLGVREHTRT